VSELSYIDKYAEALSKLGKLPPDAPQGVLDIGSNSVRLVGYSGSARTPLPIYNERAFCRLGESVSATGRIAGPQRKLALETFRRFRVIAEQLGIRDMAAFATAAVRDASNGAEFVAEAEGVLGHKIRVLSGEEEAVFAADGVMLGVPGANGLVADLGGGSLELAEVRDDKVRNWASLPLGVLALADASRDDLDRMRMIIDAALAQLDWLDSVKDRTLYIVGGTWRALAKLHIDNTQYPLEVLHQYECDTYEMQRFCRLIATHKLDLSATASNRRDALPAAALVLEKLMRATQPRAVTVSANAVREGVLYAELKNKYRRLDPLLLACEEMAERMCKSAGYGHELTVWTDKLFNHAKSDLFSSHELNRLRHAGCLISDLAWASHPSFRAEMVAQTVLTAPFVGISHKGRMFLAHALAFRHEVKEDKHGLDAMRLPPADEALARAFGLSLRLAHSLSASLPGVLPDTRLKAGRKKLKLTLSKQQAALNGPIIDKRLRLVADILGLEPVLRLGKLDKS
jgi:exopolyphosphatase/guanosine-5'-triphosphate,3'-diphosphate pyrophosphatase